VCTDAKRKWHFHPAEAGAEFKLEQEQEQNGEQGMGNGEQDRELPAAGVSKTETFDGKSLQQQTHVGGQNRGKC